MRAPGVTLLSCAACAHGGLTLLQFAKSGIVSAVPTLQSGAPVRKRSCRGCGSRQAFGVTHPLTPVSYSFGEPGLGRKGRSTRASGEGPGTAGQARMPTPTTHRPHLLGTQTPCRRAAPSCQSLPCRKHMPSDAFLRPRPVPQLRGTSGAPRQPGPPCQEP